MKFQDERVPRREAEPSDDIEESVRFIMCCESRHEGDVLRLAMANLALMVMQSEVPCDAEDARLVIDFLRTDNHIQQSLRVDTETASRMARLLRQGGITLTADMFVNQFNPRETSKRHSVTDDELSDAAQRIATQISDEAITRQFSHQLGGDNYGTLFD